MWRADLTELLAATAPASPEAANALLDELGAILDEVIGSAKRWSSAPGLIDVHSATTSPEAVDLKRSVVVEALNKRIHAHVPAKDLHAAANGDGEVRRISGAHFNTICAKAEAHPDQIHKLDIAEALFGPGSAVPYIGPRLWQRIDDVIDRALIKIGYATIVPPHQLLLYFPGYSSAMGEMKTHVIAQDISAIAQSPARPEEEPLPRPAGATAKATAAPPAAAQPKLTRKQAKEGDPFVQAMADGVTAGPAGEPAMSDLDFPSGYRTRTFPMWLAKKRAVAGAMIEAIRTDVGPRGDASLGPDHNFDLPLLAEAARQLDARVSAGKSSLLIVPVHWDYLDQPRLRARYFDFCAKLPEALRRFLVLELTGIPELLMSARVEERINQLRRLCRSVVCRVRIARRDLSQFSKMPIYAVGISLDELPHYERGIIPALDTFMDAAEAVNLRVYVHGLASKSLLIATQAAGVEFVSGPIIPEADAAPLGIRDFQIAELYGAPAIDGSILEG